MSDKNKLLAARRTNENSYPIDSRRECEPPSHGETCLILAEAT